MVEQPWRKVQPIQKRSDSNIPGLLFGGLIETTEMGLPLKRHGIEELESPR